MTRLFFRCVALLALSVLILAGCATQQVTVRPDFDRQLWAQFTAGTAVLECEAQCSSDYVHNQRDIWTRYDAQDWRGLALAVLHSGWHRDITYFFLGAAAQGLGYLEAADRYYRTAGSLASGARAMDKCATIYELCGPLSLPRDIYPRLTSVDTQLTSHGKHVDQASQIPAPRPTMSPPGGWVDPPSSPR